MRIKIRFLRRKKQKTLDDFTEKKPLEIPRRCKRILKELEKAAPNPIHHRELAFNCSLTPIELGALISAYPHCFANVERIESKGIIQYRLNLKKKYEALSDIPKKPLFTRIKLRLR